MTQMEAAKSGRQTDAAARIAENEKCDQKKLCDRIASGEVIIPGNRVHKLNMPLGIGRGLRTKVNANIGTSTHQCKIDLEVKKARVAVDAGAATVMDLS